MKKEGGALDNVLMSETDGTSKKVAVIGAGTQSNVNIKQVCLLVENEDKTKFRVVRVPRFFAEDIINNLPEGQARYVPKRVYKKFIKEQRIKYPSLTKGLTAEEIRHLAIIKKEKRITKQLHASDRRRKKPFVFDAYKEGSDVILTSDARKLKTETNRGKYKGNCRKKTKARKRNPNGFMSTGLPNNIMLGFNSKSQDIIDEVKNKYKTL